MFCSSDQVTQKFIRATIPEFSDVTSILYIHCCEFVSFFE
jgi:hypothetical protein